MAQVSEEAPKGPHRRQDGQAVRRGILMLFEERRVWSATKRAVMNPTACPSNRLAKKKLAGTRLAADR